MPELDSLNLSSFTRIQDGSDGTDEIVRWSNVTSGSDIVPLDLIGTFKPKSGSFTNDNPYGIGQNGGVFHAGGWNDKADLTFQFVRSGTNQLVTMDEFKFELTDIDDARHGVASETFTVAGVSSYDTKHLSVEDGTEKLHIESKEPPDGSIVLSFAGENGVTLGYHSIDGYTHSGFGINFSNLSGPAPVPTTPPNIEDVIPDFAWDNPGNTVIGGGGTGDDGEGFGDDGDQTLQGEDGVNNLINGTNNDDQITGGDQNDRLNGLEGNDVIRGGDGIDRLGGNAGNDDLQGDGGDDVLWGNSGDDALNGGTGNDDLHGGAGDDRLTGGEGEDTFFYDGRGDDAITDFEVGVDSLELQGLGDATVEQTDDGIVLSFGDDQGTLTVLGVDSAADLGIA